MIGLEAQKIADARRRTAWRMRCDGAGYKEIARVLGVCDARARQIAVAADKTIRQCVGIYFPDQCRNKMIYGLTLTFDHGGLVHSVNRLERNNFRH